MKIHDFVEFLVFSRIWKLTRFENSNPVEFCCESGTSFYNIRCESYRMSVENPEQNGPKMTSKRSRTRWINLTKVIFWWSWVQGYGLFWIFNVKIFRSNEFRIQIILLINATEIQKVATNGINEIPVCGLNWN